MSKWIIFNNITIVKDSILWMNCQAPVIELGCKHYSFNHAFDNPDEFNKERSRLEYELGILNE